MTRAEQLLALLAMTAPVLCCLPLARRRRPGRLAAAGAVVTVVIALVWDRHSAPYEGPAIVALTPDHGITVIDLLLPVSVAVAAAVLYRFRKG
ncbi:MAG: hypothetical protein JWN77_144 [Frankiales bacterium]|jgi:hypothetical protein|nr:hypothetical protein [Frankiales bacterium]